ncbi:hypothetical protein LUZ60_015486 [Juncus effusus]|nr:hypothetical protein LUZ60_015486 [Juncus effusus]
MGTLNLPPGFRFHPTDEEIVTEYLWKKISNPNFITNVMGDVDLNKWEPRDLPSKAKMGEKEWYFFCQKDKKYPTGTRTNRATKEGYWKATGKDKEIKSSIRGKRILIGMKKTLVFYMGRAPKGEKTNWVMHEFRLEGNSKTSESKIVQKDEWVVCRVHEKKNPNNRNQQPEPEILNQFGDQDIMDGFIDQAFFDSNNLTSSTAGTSIETLPHPSTILTSTNFSTVLINQPNNNFDPPSLYNFTNGNHIANSIYSPWQNQSWVNNPSYSNLGLLQQRQLMRNPMAPNSMLVPKSDIGTSPTFNNHE